MKITYTAPTRAHHYIYAQAMHKAGILNSFVSGFSRLSPRAGLDEIGSKLHRADILQTIYLASLRLGITPKITSQLAYLSKIEQDLASKKFIDDSDIFLFYNGCGLNTCQYAKKRGAISIVEAVNSHVQVQETILEKEHDLLNIPWMPFHKQDKMRRMQEYELADYILLPSEFVKESFIDLGFPEEKLLKVPYGFNSLSTPNHTEKDNKNDKEFTVLYVGSISVRKGVRYLIEAFDKLNHPNKRLVIVGPRAYIDGLNDLKLPPQVTFTGTLKGRELGDAYANADVFCLPSIEEGLALVLGEALSFGLPIITTTNTGASDIITDGQEGFIVPIRNSESILEKLQLLADDKDLYQSMKEAVKLKTQKLNGWDESGQLLVETLCSLDRNWQI